MVAVGVGVDVAVAVGVGVGNCAQYLPPEFKKIPLLSIPPHTIISLPLQMAVCKIRAAGALLVVVAVQLFVSGLNVPPVLKSAPLLRPAHTIMSPPVQAAVCDPRMAGALVVAVPVQLSVLGLYTPPLLK